MRSNTTMVSTDTIMLWHCRYWSRPVKGRADKKFRCDGCRNANWKRTSITSLQTTTIMITSRQLYAAAGLYHLPSPLHPEPSGKGRSTC